MRILIAMDATPSSAAVLQEAVGRPWPAGSSFALLAALDPYGFVKAPLLLQRAKEAAQKYLNSAAEQLEGAGWETNTDVILGNPMRAISGYATGWKADLLLVGSHGHSGLARFLLGSTARAVLRRALCSVEIVRPCGKEGEGGPDRKMRILIATDGTEFSAAALRSVAGRPWPKGSEAKVLSVPELILPLREFPYFDAEEAEEVNQESLKHARAFVDAGAELLSRTPLKLSTEVPVRWEMPAQGILDEAEKWKARMIVLGSHGRSGFDRLTMGSVSETVALHATCSVEVIRERSRQSKSL